MKSDKPSPDDPRLTAYALDEMAAEECPAFATRLAEDPAAQAAVEEIRALAGALGEALAQEPWPGAAPLTVSDLASPASRDGADAGTPASRIRAHPLRFPQLYYYLSGLAAACFAVFFVYWEQRHPSGEVRQCVAVDLTNPNPRTPPPAPEMVASAVPAEPAEAPVAALDRQSEPPPLSERPTVVATVPKVSVQLDPSERMSPPPADPGPLGLSGGAVAPVTAARLAGQGSTLAARSAGQAGVPIEQFAVSSSEVRSGTAAPVATGAVAGGRPDDPAAAGPGNTETYAHRADNPFLAVATNPLSTFAVDVDTAAYANVRRLLAGGQKPPPDAVRIEELVNYFPYDYAGPQAGAPLAAQLEVAAAPWAPAHRLVRIGLKGREVSAAARPPANLVFLIDVSGSMDQANKLPLVQQSLRLLLGQMRADDRVALVVYAGASGLALPSTPVREKGAILAAIDELRPGGSTNGASGIQLAYAIAKANFRPGGVNRVLLATDGDFNVGVTSEGELVRLIGEQARSGVFLTVLGFGRGNYKDALMEQLADKGNGHYACIDTLAEARKTLVEQAGGTLVTIARDVKLQVEFNPREVQAYRLIGYENRGLRAEDFNDDRVDAGEIGAGHTVTALYEVVPVGAAAPEGGGGVDALKYPRPGPPAARGRAFGELLTVKVRYQEPAGTESRKLEFPLRDRGGRFADASPDFKFAAAVAAFGMILRDSPHKGTATLAAVEGWARAGMVRDPGGHRAAFVALVRQAGETEG